MGETWDINNKPSFVVYILNDEEERFDEIKLNSVTDIHPHLLSNNILMIIDTTGSIAYMWKGKSVTIHQKFCAARIAPQVRDRHGSMSNMKILNIDEDSEPEEFKTFLNK